MSELTITPELALKLQQAARDVGLSISELNAISTAETLDLLLPLIKQQAKLVFHTPLPVWLEVDIFPDVSTGKQFIEVLEEAGIKDHFFGFDAILSQLNIGVTEPVTYELFKGTLTDLGIRESIPYDKLLRRAEILSIHDGTAPLSLITTLVQLGVVKKQEKQFKYHICTKTARANWFGQETDFVFSLANGFISEDPTDTALSKSDVLLLWSNAGSESDLIHLTEEIIFSRKKTKGSRIHQVA
ncbi:MAG: hypothetical protein RLZZ480_134 [Candidatus Parcubacteria bacterium]|jgi:hypothetical protein